MIGRITKLIWPGDPAEAPADRSILGMQASRLLEDPVLALALDMIERDLVAAWRNSVVGADQEREAAYRLHWAVEQLRAKLRGLLGDAKMIEAEQRERAKADERAAQRRA